MVEWQRLAQETKVEDAIGKVIHNAIAASCTILVTSNGQQWTGSGFHIGQGLVATAAHVCPPDLMKAPSEIALTFDSKTSYKATIAISDPTVDAAILHCPQIVSNIPTVNLADSDTAEVGDIIAVIGSPEGWHDTATVGRVSNIHQGMGAAAPTPAWNDIIFIDADILEGASGGMVIGTDGLVIGSIMGVTGSHADIGIGENSACPSNKIKALLQQLAG